MYVIFVVPDNGISRILSKYALLHGGYDIKRDPLKLYLHVLTKSVCMDVGGLCRCIAS